MNQYPADEIMAQAGSRRGRDRRGRYLGPLHGITVGLKDIYLTEGKVTEGNSVSTGASPLLRRDLRGTAQGRGSRHRGQGGHRRTGHCEPMAREKPLGLRSSCGRIQHRLATGVAASQIMVGMGTCTGGSIRGPAANCGITGLKPTYGAISLHGVLPLAWSMDHPGPMVHSARDAALVLDAVGGEDPLDPHPQGGPLRTRRSALLGAPAQHPERVVVGVPPKTTSSWACPTTSNWVLSGKRWRS